jgi:hypothetical protein
MGRTEYPGPPRGFKGLLFNIGFFILMFFLLELAAVSFALGAKDLVNQIVKTIEKP